MIRFVFRSYTLAIEPPPSRSSSLPSPARRGAALRLRHEAHFEEQLAGGKHLTLGGLADEQEVLAQQDPQHLCDTQVRTDRQQPLQLGDMRPEQALVVDIVLEAAGAWGGRTGYGEEGKGGGRSGKSHNRRRLSEVRARKGAGAARVQVHASLGATQGMDNAMAHSPVQRGPRAGRLHDGRGGGARGGGMGADLDEKAQKAHAELEYAEEVVRVGKAEDVQE